MTGKPLDPAPFHAALELHEARGRGVFCAIVAAPDPALLGHGCLLREGAAPVCEIPDGAARQAVEEAARALLAEGQEAPRRIAFKELGVVAYLEPILPPPVLLIAGLRGFLGAELVRLVNHYDNGVPE